MARPRALVVIEHPETEEITTVWVQSDQNRIDRLIEVANCLLEVMEKVRLDGQDLEIALKESDSENFPDLSAAFNLEKSSSTLLGRLRGAFGRDDSSLWRHEERAAFESQEESADSSSDGPNHRHEAAQAGNSVHEIKVHQSFDTTLTGPSGERDQNLNPANREVTRGQNLYPTLAKNGPPTKGIDSNLMIDVALKRSLEPLDITEIARRCGMSYNTVKRFVNTNPSIQRLAGYPVKYQYISDGDSTAESSFSVDIGESETRFEWLERIRHLLPVIAALPPQASFEERRAIACDLNSIGLGLLEISRDLRGDSRPNVSGHN